MDQNRAGADRPWLRRGADPYARAVALVEHWRVAGLLAGTVRQAIDLRNDINAAITVAADERAAEAEEVLLRDGYRRCLHCDAWTFCDDAIALDTGDDDAIVCSDTCRDAVEPLCPCGCCCRRARDAALPASCARRIADDLRADEEVA